MFMIYVIAIIGPMLIDEVSIKGFEHGSPISVLSFHQTWERNVNERLHRHSLNYLAPDLARSSGCTSE